MILTKSEAVQKQDKASRQGPGHGVHHDVGDHIDQGDQEGQVNGGAAQQRNLGGVLVISSDLSPSGSNSDKIIPSQLWLPCLKYLERRQVTAWSASDTSRTTLGVKSVHFDDYQMIAMWTLTEIPDADQMDEDIHGLVVIWGVKYKLLPKIKKSSLTHFNSVFWLK